MKVFLNDDKGRKSMKLNPAHVSLVACVLTFTALMTKILLLAIEMAPIQLSGEVFLFVRWDVNCWMYVVIFHCNQYATQMYVALPQFLQHTYLVMEIDLKACCSCLVFVLKIASQKLLAFYCSVNFLLYTLNINSLDSWMYIYSKIWKWRLFWWNRSK